MNKIEINRTIPSKEKLIELYVINKKPMHTIANNLNMSVGKVFKYITLYKIPTRNKGNSKGWKQTKEARLKISQANKGKIISSETRKKMSIGARKRHKGGLGCKKKRSDGYVGIYFPDHPKSKKDGFIMEHVLIMECYIGRWLKDDEVVHHKNHVRDDNRIENLQLMTFKEHARLHMLERKTNRKKGVMTY